MLIMCQTQKKQNKNLQKSRKNLFLVLTFVGVYGIFDI